MALFSQNIETDFRGIFRLDNSKLKKAYAKAVKEESEARLRNGASSSRGFLMREWPRDPKGPYMRLTTDAGDGRYKHLGKNVGNGLPWGETINDFFWPQMLPGTNALGHYSGSQIAEWCRANGEVDAAADLIDWAENVEEEPQLAPPCDILTLLRDHERLFRAPFLSPSSDSSTIFDDGHVPFVGPQAPNLLARLPLHLLPERLIVHDPYKVLLVDGTDRSSPTPEQDSIFQDANQFDSSVWEPENDMVHTYELSMNEKSKDTISKTRRELQKRYEARVKECDDGAHEYFHFPTHRKSGEVPASLKIPRARPPPPLLSVPEAHLYIHPKRALGKGHHSYVYKVEWKLPKRLFFTSQRCYPCLLNDVVDAINAEGGPLWEVWEDYLEREFFAEPLSVSEEEGTQAASEDDDEDGLEYLDDPVPIPSQPLTEDRDSVDADPSPAISNRNEITDATAVAQSTTLLDGKPPLPQGFEWLSDTSSVLEEEQLSECSAGSESPGQNRAGYMGQICRSAEILKLGIRLDLVASKTTLDSPIGSYTVRAPEYECNFSYSGPAFFYPVESKWHYPGSPHGDVCPYSRPILEPGMETAVLSVAAKLSIEGDGHLAKEANNYQHFPDHFFQHWNGLTLVRSIKTPLPVVPIVPQFYGYYVPVKAKDGSREESKSAFTALARDGGGAQKEGKNQEGEAKSLHGKAYVEDCADEEEESKAKIEEPVKDPAEYLSPILLLEDCGSPADPETLSRHDKEAYCSLLLRFHFEGWLHGSPYARNILRQPGPLTDFPFARPGFFGVDDETPSFRIVDFGRSMKHEDALHDGKLKSSWKDQIADEKRFVRRLLGPEY